jgi:hypothetical protein
MFMPQPSSARITHVYPHPQCLGQLTTLHESVPSSIPPNFLTLGNYIVLILKIVVSFSEDVL